MGKATIVEGGEGGLYVVRPAFNRTRIDAEIGSLNDELTDLEEWIARDQERLDYAELEVSEAKILADALIDILEEEGALPLVDLGNLIDLHNAQRSAQGLAPLTVSAQLNSAAQDHADWLANNNTSGHTGAGGSTPQQRIQASGYPGSGGENVAVGVLPPESNAIAAWMRSPGHKANLLRESYRHIGVGYACRSDGTFRHFWVAVFGSSLDSVSSSAPASPDSCVDTQGDGPERIREAIKELAEKSKERDIIQLDVDMLKAGRVNKWLRRRELQAIPPDPVQSAWCADYTESLAGEVGTAEIPGEGSTRLIVRPGYSGRATYVSARDGQLFHRAGQSPEQAYFNAAILPGVQKWKPTYRVGVLTAVNGLADTCSLTLDYELSSAYDLPINQSTSLTGVPIEYMECDAEAFAVGDRVLVQFQGQDWGSPKVIGFESNPKLCEYYEFDIELDTQLDAAVTPPGETLVFENILGSDLPCAVNGNGWQSGRTLPNYYQDHHFVIRGTSLPVGWTSPFDDPANLILYSKRSTINTSSSPFRMALPAEADPVLWDLDHSAYFRVIEYAYDYLGPIELPAWNSCTNLSTRYMVATITNFSSGATPPDPPLARNRLDRALFYRVDYGSREAWSRDVVGWLIANTTIPETVEISNGTTTVTMTIDRDSYEATNSSERSRITYKSWLS